MRLFRRANREEGFTILELMIATSVFSVVLLLCTFSILQIGRIYFKGLNASRAQAASRAVSDGLTDAVRFSGGAVLSSSAPVGAPPDITSGNTGAVCIGTQRFSYVKNVIVDDAPVAADREARYAFVVDQLPAGSPCTSVIVGNSLSVPADTARELIPAGMRLSELNIRQITSGTVTVGYDITVGVTSGPFDLSDGVGGGAPPIGRCKSVNGSQFCAFSELRTLAKQRL